MAPTNHPSIRGPVAGLREWVVRQLAEASSRSTIYLRIAQGLWTKPVRLGPWAVGWPAPEVVALNAARIAGRSDDELRALVVALHAARKAAAHTSVSA